RNDKQTIVRINDRGPFIKGRIIDLSRAAAREIDMVKAGVVPVRVEVLKPIAVVDKPNLRLTEGSRKRGEAMARVAAEKERENAAAKLTPGNVRQRSTETSRNRRQRRM
ncbi:MAG: RlpA-like double-psi beta-barrel domain-containing protein, partial [Chthoniobacterales bacterium]